MFENLTEARNPAKISEIYLGIKFPPWILYDTPGFY